MGVRETSLEIGGLDLSVPLPDLRSGERGRRLNQESMI